ncbi:MAG TPA: hypothetical protein PK677_05350 [Acidiphilium sp.]|nr:hypothetical protein [Acidiphilium sp.]HQU22736.1 hypothetical protein [Acidiphilium sp.]
MIDCLYLVGRGVPFEVAFELDEAVRTAFVVCFGTLDGLHFDWQRMMWEPES